MNKTLDECVSLVLEMNDSPVVADAPVDAPAMTPDNEDFVDKSVTINFAPGDKVMIQPSDDNPDGITGTVVGISDEPGKIEIEDANTGATITVDQSLLEPVIDDEPSEATDEDKEPSDATETTPKPETPTTGIDNLDINVPTESLEDIAFGVFLKPINECGPGCGGDAPAADDGSKEVGEGAGTTDKKKKRKFRFMKTESVETSGKSNEQKLEEAHQLGYSI